MIKIPLEYSQLILEGSQAEEIGKIVEAKDLEVSFER